jgi:phage gp29-like protein
MSAAQGDGGQTVNGFLSGSGTLDTGPVFTADSIQFERLSFIAPIRNLTPDRVIAANDAQEAGFLHHALRMWTQMARRSGMIFALKDKRESAVAQRSWSTMQTNAVTDDPSLKGEALAQKKWLNYFWNNMTCSCAWDQNVTGGYAVFVRLLMAVQSFRYVGLHFCWKPSPKGLTAHIEIVPGWFFENLTGTLRFLGTTPTSTYGEAMDPTNWLMVAGSGVMEPASILWTMENAGFNTLADYCERYGMPFPLGKTNAARNSDEWRNMREAVAGMRRNKGAVIGTGGTLELLAAAGSGTGPSESFLSIVHRVLSVIFRGGDLSTLSSTSGQGTGSNSQDRDGLLLESADCQMISEVMQRIDRLVIDWNETGAPYLAYSQMKGPNLADIKQEMAVDQMGINNGVQIPVSDWCDRYNRRQADPGEPCLAPAASGAPADPELEGEPGALNTVDDNGREHLPTGSPDGGRFMSAAMSGEMAGVREKYQKSPLWMKAPNGLPTQMSEHDWVLSHTPSFLADHGDWTALHGHAVLGGPVVAHVKTGDLPIGPADQPVAAAQRWLAEHPTGALHHPALGDVAPVSSRAVKNSLSHGMGVKKLQSLTAVPQVIRHGAVIYSEPDKQGKTLLHHVVAAPVTVDGERHSLLVRLRQDITPGNHASPPVPHFYVHEVFLEKDVNPATSGPAASVETTTPHGMTGFMGTLAREAHAVNPAAIHLPMAANGEPDMKALRAAHNSAAALDDHQPAISDELRASVVKDLQPFATALAARLQNPESLQDFNWDKVAAAVLENGNLTAVILGELADAAFDGFGISEADIHDILNQVTAKEGKA